MKKGVFRVGIALFGIKKGVMGFCFLKSPAYRFSFRIWCYKSGRGLSPR
ncbi:Uncharacterized protein dnm_023410 [Desulfonema magnum]|uniref:Uncharacterized protein n=1 Tax=Desulfonema magnum TaxID=45655 RepID=A0A975BJJ0_9BACT|nr:Uncharacterized protein dnm_023410 [Desulfonema magnum]